MIGSVLDHWPRHCSFALRSLVKRDSLTCDFECRSMPVLVRRNSVEKIQFRQIESLHLPAITPTHARRSCFAGNFEEEHVQKRHGLDLSDTLVARIEAPWVLLNFVIEYVIPDAFVLVCAGDVYSFLFLEASKAAPVNLIAEESQHVTFLVTRKNTSLPFQNRNSSKSSSLCQPHLLI